MGKSGKPKAHAAPKKPHAPPAKKQSPAKPQHAMSKSLRGMKFMQRHTTSFAAATTEHAGGQEHAPVDDAATEKPNCEYFGRRSFGGFNPAMEEAFTAFYKA